MQQLKQCHRNISGVRVLMESTSLNPKHHLRWGFKDMSGIVCDCAEIDLKLFAKPLGPFMYFPYRMLCYHDWVRPGVAILGRKYKATARGPLRLHLSAYA